MRDRLESFFGSPGEFLRDHRYGIVKLISFYNYLFRLGKLMGTSYIISYEDFKEDSQTQFRNLVSYLGLPKKEKIINQVITEGFFDNLQKLGLNKEYLDSPLSPANPDNINSYKVRSGFDTDFFNIFNQEDLLYISTVVDCLLSRDVPDSIRHCFKQPERTN